MKPDNIHLNLAKMLQKSIRYYLQEKMKNCHYYDNSAYFQIYNRLNIRINQKLADDFYNLKYPLQTKLLELKND